MTEEKEEFNNEVGIVTSVKKYLLSLRGLPSAKVNDILEDKNGNMALVTSLEDGFVRALMLDSIYKKPGDRFFLKSNEMIFSFGDYLFGRIINVLGKPIDGKAGFTEKNASLELNVVASGINSREFIKDQFSTGIIFVDTLFPIGKGQRQLVFGPPRSGKTSFLKDVVVNQKDQDTICIYVAIGRPIDAVQRIAASVFEKNDGKNTIFLAALSNDIPPLVSIAPSVAFSIAEYFSKKGKDVLLILDDLGTHAKYVREIALLEGRLPGRESYPGDMFYQHAHLMERAGHFNKKFGGGSITLLPVLETEIKNSTDLIPTNLMSATDGHFSFSSALRAQGYYPSIRGEQSVTRVGSHTQKLAQRQLANKILILLAEYKTQKEYTQFGSQLSKKTQEILRNGDIVEELLKQEIFELGIQPNIQVVLLSLIFTSFTSGKDKEFVEKNKKKIIKTISESPEMEDVRELAKTDTQVKEFIDFLETKIGLLEKICQ
jgi:F-type H+-transporting ATPase subunit alpha